MITAAVLLALGLLITPAPARHRLVTATRIRAPRLGTVWSVVPAIVVGLVVLEPTTVLAGVIVAGTVMCRRRRAARRSARDAESADLRDALDILVGELRVGAHPVAALAAAAAEVGGRVGPCLDEVSARGRLGADIAVGLQSMAAHSAIPAQWQRMAVCWQLAAVHGVAIATLMRAAQHDIIERSRFRQRLDAGLAGPRTTAAVLAGMPVLGIALGQLIGARPVQFLLSGGTGGVVLLIGVGLSCLGLFWSDRIIAGVAA